MVPEQSRCSAEEVGIMSVEDNKKIVAQFFEDLSAGNGVGC
jgi:hypothetical protein